MIDAAVRTIDKLSRSLAYDILCTRDRLSGWKPKRAQFLASVRKDRESLEKDVERKLRNILLHAYETSPYYRGVWERIGFSPSPCFKLEDLQRLPFLTKAIIKEQALSLVSDRFQRSELDLDYTGGTTGTQTPFYRDHECTVSRVGRQWGMLELCGYRPGTRRALVWGAHADLPHNGVRGSIKKWFRKFASSQEILSCTVMSEQNMLDYYRRLERFKPSVLYGYPKAMVQFGRLIQERHLEPIKVRTIITTAERLAPAQREFVQKVYGGEVFNLYGTREYGCIGFECEKHAGFHIDIESVFVEIIKDGRPVDPGESGEITITDLLNYGMPFIRSRTGDFGALSPKLCECGSPLPVLQGLDGRDTDWLYKADGSTVAGLMLTDLFMDLSSIRFAQFVQESVKELEVWLVVTGDFSSEVENEAVRQVKQLMGPEIDVHVRRVPELPRNPRSGKCREVICKIGRNEGLNQTGSHLAP